ncbi:MAG TPA: DUF4238 domain-containing protein [Stellaceae bacterium]|nr:DUF4238 domain-containing protein [Stellaceae bacterium]
MLGLYTFSELPPDVAEWLEDEFFRVADDGGAVVLKRLVACDIEFDGPTKTLWSRFLLTLLHRNPEGIQRITRRIANDFPEEFERIREQYDSIRGETALPSFDEIRAKLSRDAMARVQIRVLQNVMDSELVGTALNEMYWGVFALRRPRHSLLTSDRPIVISNGLAKADAHLVMPLSPIRIFVAAKSKEVIQQLERMRDEIAATLNDRIVRQARNFVYGADTSQLRFIANRLGEKRKWSSWE